jgi:biotin carboxyl carrier protein
MKRTVRLKSRNKAYTVELDGTEKALGTTASVAGGVWVSLNGRNAFFEKDSAALHAHAGAADPDVRSPMTGKVIAVRVKPGDAVKEGDVLVILEAMKMEYRLAAPMAGQVESVTCKENEQVDLGQPLVRLGVAP